jgi:phage host-nuclease inhibitor protein Gam
MKKSNKNRVEITSESEARIVLDDIAALTVQSNLLAARYDEMIANARTAADWFYAADIATTKAQLKAKIASLQEWAEANKPALFSDARSVITPTGSFGFRTGMPKVELIRGWNAERVVNAVLSLFPKRGWLRQSWDLDKEAMIADRDKAAADLAEVGVKVKQSETFFVDINLEEATKRHAS